MPGPDVLAAAAILLALILYTVTGGADFGGGVWDLFASGPRARLQRETVARALAPIWEANHVWLIAVVVLLFVAFPAAFATICTMLYVPLMLMLIGIVLRGAAFAFRSYAPGSPSGWDRLFAVSSLVTPVMLGTVAGAVASGRVRAVAPGPRASVDFLSSWLAPFPVAIGLFTLALFAFLAAAYLTLETDDPLLKEDFRLRALVAGAAVGVLAWACFLLAGSGAPRIRHGLGARVWSVPFQAATAAVAVSALWALWDRRYPLARWLAAAQASLIVLGWGLSQYPYLVAPDLTIAGAAALPEVLRPVLWVLAAGGALLAPSFWYLFRIFKGRR